MSNELQRIADALERIATCLEEKNVKSEPGRRPRENPDSLALARRVVGGETMTSIAADIGCLPPNVRARVLAVFRGRNRKKYDELRQLGDYGCTAEPSMRLLVKHATDFGI